MTGLPTRPQRLWSLVESRASTHRDALLAVGEHDDELTFGALRDRAEALAATLAARGVGPGMPVAWQLPTGLPAIVLVAALARLDAVQVPLLPIYRERELRFILAETRPGLVLARESWREVGYTSMLAAVVAELGLTTDVVAYGDSPRPRGPASEPGHTADRNVDGAADGELRGLPDAPVAPAAGDAWPVRWVFYTSGTTGAPKGARHTDATLYAGSAGVANAYRITDRDRYPIVFPFTHIGGIGMLVIQLLTGCGAVAVEQFVADRTPELLARHGITIAAGGTPLALVYLARQRTQPDRPLFPALRAVMTGAAPKPPGLHAELRDEMGGTGALACYGLTEAPFLTVSDVADPDDRRDATEGRAIGGAVLRIVDPSGEPCPPGVVGEIQAIGPQICLGYLDPTRDADAFVDGWFRTGDLGTLDADGYLVINGRLKDIIIRKGENISAREVEDVVYAHESVADVAVVGLPDATLGERCCAVVVVRDGCDPPSLADLAAHCRAHGLAIQKTPERLEVVVDLPRNAAGKVLKHELRAMLAPAGPAAR